MKKRILSIVLMLVMLVSVVPMPQAGFVVGGLAPGGFRGCCSALSGADVEPRLQGKPGE